MLRLSQIKLSLEHTNSDLSNAIIKYLDINSNDLINYTVFKRSYDARRSAMLLSYILDISLRDEAKILHKFKHDKNVLHTPDMSYKYVCTVPSGLVERPLIIGFGPSGIFAALILAQMGFRPIVLERGKEVRERTQDTWGLWRGQVLNPESNVQFGEGGAGTFSDGKLYSQVRDPYYLGRKVIDEFIKAGAPSEIAYLSKPHIGTFRLVSMVEKIRATIENIGGEIHFNHKVVDLLISNKNSIRQIEGVILADGKQLFSKYIVLALGHSARDTFSMLHTRGVFMEQKPFSIGFRVEHPQTIIDKARFGKNAGHALLGSADYKLAYHASNGRTVYSFCMCPGGTVVAATSEAGHVVTNGMSQYSRNERNANSAIVVGVTSQDFPSKHPLAGIELQRSLERNAFALGGSNYYAPAQLIGDFINGVTSKELGMVNPSYKPGVTVCNLSKLLPEYATFAIKEALPEFNKQIHGYTMPDGVLTGVETRTSSPVRITRGDNFQSLNTMGLYPAGEGAGYAGGILSAGIDGIKVAQAVALCLSRKI